MANPPIPVYFLGAPLVAQLRHDTYFTPPEEDDFDILLVVDPADDVHKQRREQDEETARVLFTFIGGVADTLNPPPGRKWRVI
jgi:hypothetical protein